jgi:hypothetical protein
LRLILIALLSISIVGLGQTGTTNSHKCLTSKYAGWYEYGRNIEKGRIGYLLIYPETDSTILFYIGLNRGAPSHNMGNLYGRIKILNDTGTFFTRFDSLEKGCELSFHFSNSKIEIITLNDRGDCEFGFGVYADGNFQKISDKVKEFFQDMEGKKVYFIKTKPENYYKE